MKLRIATFNVENLFSRPKAMNNPTWKEGQPALDAAAKLNALFNQETYSAADKKKMLALLADNGLLATRPQNTFLELRKVRGKLFTVPKDAPPTIVADGRSSWVGWIALKTAPIKDAAIDNTARVIAEVNPDVLVCVEIEDRPALKRFHDDILAPLLKKQGAALYGHEMSIAGNDERGINVGILSRFPIRSMRSHITHETNGKRTFSRDCPEYYLDLGPKKELVVLPNHFASKGSDKTGARRKVQATAVASFYADLRKTHDHILIAGDYSARGRRRSQPPKRGCFNARKPSVAASPANDHPKGGSLDALLDTDLQDAMALPAYKGPLPGTYAHARADEKIDYLLMSPKLAGSVKAVDVCRKGFYAPTKWDSYEDINAETKDRNQASDHHCVWADVEV